MIFFNNIYIYIYFFFFLGGGGGVVWRALTPVASYLPAKAITSSGQGGSKAFLLRSLSWDVPPYTDSP